MCFDLESESITSETKIEKPSESSKILIESGEDCLYFVTGTKLGKLDISNMNQEFMIDTHHTGEIIGMIVSSDNQIITTSLDGSLRFFHTLNGSQIAQPMEEMEIDEMAC